ncbi:MAG: signal peptidase I [Clostridia bacterium]|nr:signal peptidase I [Clostridia bacterium]
MENSATAKSTNRKKKKEPWEIVLKDRFLKNEKPDNPYLTALLYFIVCFLSFLLVFVCFFQLCEIKGASMLNTLHDGDHILLLRISTQYKRGDIVIITKEKEDSSQSNKNKNIVKRVVAVAGDSIRFDLVNNGDDAEVVLYLMKKGTDEFLPVSEPYLKEPMNKNSPSFSKIEFGKEIKIEDGFIYVLGDNRNISQDSREDGPYSTKYVYGKRVLTVEKGSLLEKLLSFLYHPNDAVD